MAVNGLLGTMKNVDEAYLSDANHMGEADAGLRLLPGAGFAPELFGDFNYLANAGRPKGMSHGDKAA